MLPAFQLRLNHDILLGLATVGKYDGKHPCLTCGTNAGKVFIHNPHARKSEPGSEIRFLNINQKITSIRAGSITPVHRRDALFVGSHTSILAYDVENNTDIFYRDVADGVNSIAIGRIREEEMPYAIVGGNCSILGFNSEGDESYWTVTGDNVTSMLICDINEDGRSELMVGSEDCDIRVFQGEEVIAEYTESDKVIGLAHMRGPKFGYALANGTVGVYNKTKRSWRNKTKSTVNAIESYDLDADGLPELVSGWASGKLEIRSETGGEIVFKDHFGTSISAIVKADYRMDGKEEVICCSQDGEVRGYLPREVGQSPTTRSGEKTVEEEMLLELAQKKQDLLREIKLLEESLSGEDPRKRGQVTSISESGEQFVGVSSANILPASTRIVSRLQFNPSKKSIELCLISEEATAVIHSAILFAEQMFEGESLFVHPKTPSGEVRIPISPPKDVTISINIKAIVGTPVSTSFAVFELTEILPRFSLLIPTDQLSADPKSVVTFKLNERIPKVIAWLKQSFLLAQNPDYSGDLLVACFISIRDNKPVKMVFRQDSTEFQIRTDDMEVAADIIQDLSGYMKLNELESTADFPIEMEAFREVLLKVDEYNNIRLKLTAEMADSSQLIKAMVIRAEDSRIHGDIKSMRKCYTTLLDLNRELIGEYNKRAANHGALLNCLKEVNQMIQKASRLRMGDAKSRVVSCCREAIKTNNVQALYRIIRYGHPGT